MLDNDQLNIVMLANELYSIIATDESAVTFLKVHELLPMESEELPCERCGCEMRQVVRSKRLRDGSMREYQTLRCTGSRCQTYRSIRQQNPFFSYVNLNGHCHSNLSLGQILEICYYWCLDLPQVSVAALTGRCAQAVCDWYNLCRDVCVKLFEGRDQLGGEGEVVEIDECLLRGKRKANRGRLLLGDLKHTEAEEDSQETDNVESRRNYGRRIEGPWVFGLCSRRRNSGEVLERRFFVVERRDRATLIPIILREVARGTTIRSDEWGAYRGLESLGFRHETVNHQHFFIDPDTHCNTQTIECLGHTSR